jgi:hypothetical protein
MEPEGSLPHSQVPFPILNQLDPVHAPHPTSWRFILILSSHLLLGLPSGLFPSGFPTKTLYTHSLSIIRATCSAHHILLDFISRKTFGVQYRSLSSSICNFLHSPVTSSLNHTYFPQYPILKHPQPTFLPQYERPSFTPIQNNRQIYSSLYLFLYIFGYKLDSLRLQLLTA